MVLTSYRHGFHHGAVSAWSCWLSAEKKVSTQDKHLQESRSRKETNCLIGNDWHPVSFANPFFSGSSPRSFCPSLYEPPVSFRTKLTSPAFYNLVLMHSHLDPDMCLVSSFYNISWLNLLFIIAFQSHWFFGISLLGIGLWGQSKAVYCQGLSLKDLVRKQLFSLGYCQISRKLPLFRWK